MYGEVIMSVFIGLLTSLYIAFFLFRGKELGMSLMLIFSGFIGGWIGGIFWMFITGGLSYHILMAVPAVVITSLLCFFILSTTNIKMREKRIGRVTSSFVIAGILVLLLISVLVVAIAPVQINGYAVEDICPSCNRDSDIGSYTGVIDITADIACVNFPDVSANPAPGDYIKFAVQFDVSDYAWEQPYIKLVVVQDENEDGEWDSGDTVWDDADWKICIGDTGDDPLWRSNILYDENGGNALQIHYGNSPLPIYHSDAGQFTVWADDSDEQCSNTHEGYTSPRDQLSWQSSGSSSQQKETVNGFYAISVGSSSKIYGKIYCVTEHTGKNLLVIQAFDKRFQTNPLTESTPLSEKMKPFTISTNPDPDPDNWMWIAGGGVGLIVISSLARRKKQVVYYPPSAPPTYYPPQ